MKVSTGTIIVNMERITSSSFVALGATAVVVSSTVMLMMMRRRAHTTLCNKTITSWSSRVVRSHGPLQEIWPQVLYTLEAPGCSKGPPVRNMSIYRVPDNSKRLVIYNGVSINDDTLKEIEALGTPTILVVPNGMHREDAAIWKDKFPKIVVVCPIYDKKKISDVVPIDMTMDEWVKLDDWSSFVTIKDIDGWCKFEHVLEVQLDPKKDGKVAMMICDLLFTLVYDPNFSWSDKIISWAFDCCYITPTDKNSIIIPKVSRIARVFVIKDWKKAEQWYRSYAKECGKSIAVILVGHGVPIVEINPDEGCTKALEGVADQLIKPRW